MQSLPADLQKQEDDMLVSPFTIDNIIIPQISEAFSYHACRPILVTASDISIIHESSHLDQMTGHTFQVLVTFHFEWWLSTKLMVPEKIMNKSLLNTSAAARKCSFDY